MSYMGRMTFADYMVDLFLSNKVVRKEGYKWNKLPKETLKQSSIDLSEHIENNLDKEFTDHYYEMMIVAFFLHRFYPDCDSAMAFFCPSCHCPTTETLDMDFFDLYDKEKTEAVCKLLQEGWAFYIDFTKVHFTIGPIDGGLNRRVLSHFIGATESGELLSVFCGQIGEEENLKNIAFSIMTDEKISESHAPFLGILGQLYAERDKFSISKGQKKIINVPAGKIDRRRAMKYGSIFRIKTLCNSIGTKNEEKIHGSGKKLDHMVKISGHWRNQAFGPGRKLRKKIFIADHVHGAALPKKAPIYYKPPTSDRA